MGEAFDEDAVFRKQAGVVEAESMVEEFSNLLSVRAGEVGAGELQFFFNGGFFCGGAEVQAH